MNKQGENLTVIVIVYNRLDYTMRTLNSLFKTVPKANFVIFDNHSDEKGMTDYLNTLVYTRSHLKNLNILLGDENVGWGRGVNEALHEVQENFAGCNCGRVHKYEQEYFLISNNDVEYFDGWYEQCTALYEKYPQIGILGVWKHTAHGVLEDKGDLIVKDQMPAVGWLITPEHLKDIGLFSEHGPCATKGGNGEDVDYCIRATQKGYLVAGLPEDVANHFDGY